MLSRLLAICFICLVPLTASASSIYVKSYQVGLLGQCVSDALTAYGVEASEENVGQDYMLNIRGNTENNMTAVGYILIWNDTKTYLSFATDLYPTREFLISGCTGISNLIQKEVYHWDEFQAQNARNSMY